MSLLTEEPSTAPRSARCRQVTAVPFFPPRVGQVTWPATRYTRGEALALFSGERFAVSNVERKSKRAVGLRLLLEWLAQHPGHTWQERWLSSGADRSGRVWRRTATTWLEGQGHGPWRREATLEALPTAISADLVRPSLSWLVDGGAGTGGLLVRNLAASRDPDGFARLRTMCESDNSVSTPLTTQVLYRSALILATKGGTLAQVTIGDVTELFDAEAEVRVNPSSGRNSFYRILRDLGVFGTDAPPILRGLRTSGQRTPEELIDRYQIACRPVRDLLVDYLRERQPALDYTSLDSLSYHLGKRFWADIEAHHPGIDNLRLPREVSEDWKRRLRTITKTTTSPTGEKTEITVPRISYRELSDSGPRLLPRPGALGGGGPQPLGCLGGALPGR